MRTVFVLNHTVRVPRALVWLLLPAAVSLTVIMAFSLIASLVLGPSSDFNFLEWLPRPVYVAVLAWGIYTGIGAVALWFAMWVYWGFMERSSYLVRAMWFFVLLLGMHLGALAYLLYLWIKGILRIESVSPDGVRSRAIATGK